MLILYIFVNSVLNTNLDKKTFFAALSRGFLEIGSVHKWSRQRLISGGMGSSGFRVASGVPPTPPLNDNIFKNLDLRPASRNK